MLSKISLTNPPPITNKGKERTSEVENEAIISLKEDANRSTLQTITVSTLLHRIPSMPIVLGRTQSYELTICVLSATPMVITLINVLTWLASNNFSRMKINVIQTRLL